MVFNKKIIYSIALVVAFIAVFGLGIWVGVTKIAYHVPQPGTIDFSLFWDAYGKLQQNFIDPSKIDNQKVIYGAIEGMTNSLGDPYTEFFNPQQAQIFQSDLAGSFDGIGVEIGMKNDLLTVIAPLPGTPGDNAGLKSGDEILKINGKDATNTTVDEAVDLIRGPKGTSVTLNIFRNGWSSARDFKITRDTIVVPSMKWSLKDNDVAYIQIFQFDETLPSDFKTAALQILQSPAKKIVLDLRGDPGGYLESAQDVAGWFLQNGQTVAAEDFGKNKTEDCGVNKSVVVNGETECLYVAQGNAELANYPIVVLIDQGSASASEILAGALRDNKNIKLIGTKSFGKGSVQEVVNLNGGSFLKITIARWLTPKGNSISEIGLTPDVKVDITDQDISAKKDPQLDKALEIVQSMPTGK
ncbi:MAG: S41 family peptidase [Candidatus Staskawiczbacteria bacterium]|jgi:carboxyl-terminal processing protease